MKKVMKDVYISDDPPGANVSVEVGRPVHYCEGTPDACWYSIMVLRDNEDGPLYWCENCGYTIEGGAAMAIRLNEVPL